MSAEVRRRVAPLVKQLSPETARHILNEADRIGVLGRLESLWNELARNG